MLDQASKLRKMVDIEKNELVNKSTKILSIVSGKGGVGKTNLSVNLAIKLQQMGKKVLILDADIGLNNTHILLGVNTQYNLFHLINEDIALEDIIMKGPEGVDILSGGTDLLQIDALNYDGQKKVLDALNNLAYYDIIIIDNSAGIRKESMIFSVFAHDIILITTPEPTAITDAYSFLKAISIYKLSNTVKIVINQISDKATGEDTFIKLSQTSEKFLNLKLENLGFVFNDIRVRNSIMDQLPVVIKYPNSLASQNFEQISNAILNDSKYNFKVSNFKQFSNRLLKIFG